MKDITEKQLEPFRPIPFYYITSHDPEELSYESFYKDLSAMKEAGYGGVIIFNRPPEGFNQELYFTEAWFDMVGNCIRACADLGLRVWINDDYDCPPGDMGGRLEKIAPHLKPLRLFLTDDGEVEVREVEWGFPAFEEEESALLFQKYVYEEYKRRFGEYFGNTVVGMFTDADSRRVNCFVLNPASPMRDYFPWSKNFAQSFQERYGYDITPYLPSIIRRETSPQARDYWEHSGQLYMSWFASNYRWLQENGLESTFHTSDSAPFRITTSYFNSAFAEGKAIDAGTRCDYPGTDHECLKLNGGCYFYLEHMRHALCFYGSDTDVRPFDFYEVHADLRAKQAQSCAYLHDKKGVMCEMYAGATWAASYKELRNILAWQLMQGVTFIVLQAYHYRLRGETKHFAPLTFGPHSHAEFAMRQFNDSAARYAYICSQGKLKVDLALLDPTDFIWEGSGDSEIELLLAKELNHYPQGYVISDLQSLSLKAKELKAVINPGLPLTGEQRQYIASLGLKLYEYYQLDRVKKEIDPGISWKGDGEVMFMRRQLEDGSEMLVVGNIESDDTLVGTITFQGKQYEIELTSGELAFFGGGFDDYRAVCHDPIRVPLTEEVPVTFEKPNIIPLARWEYPDGRPFPLTAGSRDSWYVQQGWGPPDFPDLQSLPLAQTPLFPFTATAPLDQLEVLIPNAFQEHIHKLYLDDVQLTAGETVMIFDDYYTSYPISFDKGRHCLKLDIDPTVSIGDHIFLRGNFDVDAQILEMMPLHYGKGYSISCYFPEAMSFTFSARRSTLKTGQSWTVQGQPFYSGSVTYHFEAEIPAELQNPVLVLPSLGNAVKLYINGELKQVGIYPPFRLPLGVSGKVAIDLEVANTLANMLDCAALSSGIAGTPYITEQPL